MHSEQRRHSGWRDTDRLDSFDCTIANLSELVCDVLDAAGSSSVAEVGAEHGLFTERLLAWGTGAEDRRVSAVDPYPRPRLVELAAAHPELELVQRTSLDALPELDLPDAVILDGDHNYFTVSEELRLIGERAGGSELPLLLCHDIGWPLARRDSYHDIEQIPAQHRQPAARDVYLTPDVPGIAERGLYYECTAIEEGGPRNGVLTAVEDFLATRSDLRLAVVAPFFGLGVIWPAAASYAPALEATLGPWASNPMLERVERKRIEHLVAEFENLQRIDEIYTQDYVYRYRLIGRLLPYADSSALALAERLSAIKQRGRANISRDDLVALLEELAAGDIDVDELRRNPEHAPERYRIRLAEPEDGGRTRPRAAPGDLANETF